MVPAKKKSTLLIWFHPAPSTGNFRRRRAQPGAAIMRRSPIRLSVSKFISLQLARLEFMWIIGA
jgi:hypothetical protein